MDPTAGLDMSDEGKNINVSTWTLVGLSLLFLGLRVACKMGRHRGLWWDDHLLIASWVRLQPS